jgi:hypothetical protein
MSTQAKKQPQGQTKHQPQSSVSPNPLEALKDIGMQTAADMRAEIAQFPDMFMDQLLGTQTSQAPHRSGELSAGDSMEMNDVLSGRSEEMTVMREQISFERRLLQEEKAETNKKTNELKMQLSQVQRELIGIAQSTQELAQETQIATMQVTIDPGVYHVIFFEKLLEFIKSFRKKINQSSQWLSSANKRAGKKGSWTANYKQHGAKYLLSGEHYVARSAG